eukprot:UN02197
MQPLVDGSPGLKIVRVLVLCTFACLLTLVLMRYLVNEELKTKLLHQSAIFNNKHNWWMTYLYFMTFGSFIGFSAALPKLIKDVFGYLPNGDKNPNAPDPADYAWLGPLAGSLARPIGT